MLGLGVTYISMMTFRKVIKIKQNLIANATKISLVLFCSAFLKNSKLIAFFDN